ISADFSLPEASLKKKVLKREVDFESFFRSAAWDCVAKTAMQKAPTTERERIFRMGSAPYRAYPLPPQRILWKNVRFFRAGVEASPRQAHSQLRGSLHPRNELDHSLPHSCVGKPANTPRAGCLRDDLDYSSLESRMSLRSSRLSI